MLRYNLFLWSVKGSVLGSSITVNLTSKVLLSNWEYFGGTNMGVTLELYQIELYKW